MEQLLKQLGLTINETRVYKNLIKKGGCTMTEISRASKIKRSSAQEYIKSLINKGFVLSSKIENKFYYQTEDPDKIRQIINERLFIVDKFIELLQRKEIINEKWQISSPSRPLSQKNRDKLTKRIKTSKKLDKDTQVFFNTQKVFISSLDKNLPFIEIKSSKIANFHKFLTSNVP